MNKAELSKKITDYGEAVITFEDRSYQVVTLDITKAKVKPQPVGKVKATQLAVFSWSRFANIIVDPETVINVGPCPVTNRK